MSTHDATGQAPPPFAAATGSALPDGAAVRRSLARMSRKRLLYVAYNMHCCLCINALNIEDDLRIYSDAPPALTGPLRHRLKLVRDTVALVTPNNQRSDRP